MPHLREFPTHVRTFLRFYPWRRIHPTPWTPLRVPLAEARVALVSSAGLVAPGQEPFDKQVRGGDYSFRTMSNDIDVHSLKSWHRSDAWDHRGVESDRNLAFPLDRLREFQSAGRIGSLNHRHLSFMGSITAPGRLIRKTAPEAARWLASDQVDVALLVPV